MKLIGYSIICILFIVSGCNYKSKEDLFPLSVVLSDNEKFLHVLSNMDRGLRTDNKKHVFRHILFAPDPYVRSQIYRQDIILLEDIQNQLPAQPRYPNQTYLEDSTHVFWTGYPNPFSPPTVTEYSKGLIKGEFSFYCDISDSVEVAFITQSDSIVHKATLLSRKPPYFSVGYWRAGPLIDPESLPPDYFKAHSYDHLRLVIIVDGRWKSIREVGIRVREGWYYWIDDRK